MSVVTGFVLVCSLSDSEKFAENQPGNVSRINAWLSSHNFAAIQDLAAHSAGSKHPQFCIFVSGYNQFPEEEFILFFESLKWEEPDNCVLTLQPEEGRTRVFRPKVDVTNFRGFRKTP